MKIKRMQDLKKKVKKYGFNHKVGGVAPFRGCRNKKSGIGPHKGVRR